MSVMVTISIHMFFFITFFLLHIDADGVRLGKLMLKNILTTFLLQLF